MQYRMSRIINSKLFFTFHFLFLILLLSLFTGCHTGYKGQEIVIEGEGIFPPEAAGIWKTDNDKYEIEFREDGSIVSALIPLGNIRLYPGEVKKIEMPKYEGKGIFEPGPWQVLYDTETKDLTVVLAIEHFYQDVGPDSLEGSHTDILSGTLDLETGRWLAQLFSKGRIEALIWDGWTLIDRKELLNFPEPVQRDLILLKKQP